MDKRIRKIIIIALFSIVAAYWAAFKLSTFGTVMVASIPMLYFIATAIESVWKLIKSREVRTNLVIGLVSILTCLLITHSCIISDHGLRNLTKQRMQTLNQLRPTLLKYKEENGFYPHKLQDLIPKYVQLIPPELVNDGKDDGYKHIDYEVINSEALFRFHQMRGPDSGVTYHVRENRYEYEQ